MRPILFEFGGVAIVTYPVMLALACLLGFWLSYRESLRKGYAPDLILSLALISLITGVIGGRTLSWLLNQTLYADEGLGSILHIWDKGGSSSFGGIALASLVGLAWIRWQGMRAWDVADLLVFAWVPFLAVVRVGCFLNGCCYGLPTMHPFGLVAGGPPTAVNFGIRSHPTQLYAVAALLTIFGLLAWLRTRRRFEGQLTVVFFVAYGVFRCGLETLRGDTHLAWRFGDLGIFSVNQLISVPVVLIGACAWLYLARRGQPPGGESGVPK